MIILQQKYSPPYIIELCHKFDNNKVNLATLRSECGNLVIDCNLTTVMKKKKKNKCKTSTK